MRGQLPGLFFLLLLNILRKEGFGIMTSVIHQSSADLRTGSIIALVSIQAFSL